MTSIKQKKHVTDADFHNKKVMVRVDWNIPIKNGKIVDPFRIVSSLKTIKFILSKNPSSLIIITHLGRPNGKVDSSASLDPLFSQIQNIFKENGIQNVFEFKSNSLTDKEKLKKLSNDINNSKQTIFLLENIRFYKGEESLPSTPEHKELAHILSSLCDVFVLDAFACAHRPHVSISSVSPNTPKSVISGILMAEELEKLDAFLGSENKFATALGGAKVSDKVKLINNLLKRTSILLIGGAMANSFLKFGKGVLLGSSKVEESEDVKKAVKEILENAEKLKVQIILPVDLVLEDERIIEIGKENLKDNEKALDIGPKTVQAFITEASKYGKVFWNGPFGYFEDKKFGKGTKEFLKGLKDKKVNGKIIEIVVGGGDTAAAVHEIEGIDKMSNVYISTGGGASLEMMEGSLLPGLSALSYK